MIFAGFFNSVMVEVFVFLLAKILFKLVNVGIFYDFFAITLFEVYLSEHVMKLRFKQSLC